MAFWPKRSYASRKGTSVVSDEIVEDPIGTRLAGRYPLVYILLLLASMLVLADAHLPAERCLSTVADARQVDMNNSTRRRRVIDHWCVVTLDNGLRFQVMSTMDAFPQGDTLELSRTPLLGEVLRYRNLSRGYRMWNTLSLRDREYEAFPVLVSCCALLLLLPVTRAEFRWSAHAALALLVFSWLLTMLGTEGMKWLF